MTSTPIGAHCFRLSNGSRFLSGWTGLRWEIVNQVDHIPKAPTNAVRGHTQKQIYLVATKTDVGLILNFGERKITVKRKLRTLC
jgi:hypothetical protein